MKSVFENVARSVAPRFDIAIDERPILTDDDARTLLDSNHLVIADRMMAILERIKSERT